MADLNIAYLCLPEIPIAGCEEKRCSQCTIEQFGKSWCGGTKVQGCFFALHSLCGLICHLITIEDCDPKLCHIGPFGPACEDMGIWGDNCDECPSYVSPGEFVCQDDDIEACWVVEDWCPTCGDYCIFEIIDCPDGWTCIDENGAICVLP